MYDAQLYFVSNTVNKLLTSYCHTLTLCHRLQQKFYQRNTIEACLSSNPNSCKNYLTTKQNLIILSTTCYLCQINCLFNVLLNAEIFFVSFIVSLFINFITNTQQQKFFNKNKKQRRYLQIHTPHTNINKFLQTCIYIYLVDQWISSV